MLDSWSNHYILSTYFGRCRMVQTLEQILGVPLSDEQPKLTPWVHGSHPWLLPFPPSSLFCDLSRSHLQCSPAATGSMAWRIGNGQPTGLCLCYWRDTGSRPKGRGTTLYVTAVFCMLRVQNTPCFFLSCVNSSLCLQMLCRSWNSLHATRSRKGRCSSISSAAQDDSRMKWKSWFPALEVYLSSRGVSNCF